MFSLPVDETKNRCVFPRHTFITSCKSLVADVFSASGKWGRMFFDYPCTFELNSICQRLGVQSWKLNLYVWFCLHLLLPPLSPRLLESLGASRLSGIPVFTGACGKWKLIGTAVVWPDVSNVCWPDAIYSDIHVSCCRPVSWSISLCQNVFCDLLSGVCVFQPWFLMYDMGIVVSQAA